MDLQKALANPLWLNHKIGDTYKMDGEGEWKIAYYPIFECGRTGEVYNEPRALVERKATWKGVEGTDFREIPLIFLVPNQ